MSNTDQSRGCKTCVFWVQQRNNKDMGHCQVPLPESVRELVGKTVMERGMWLWVGSVRNCETHRGKGIALQISPHPEKEKAPAP